MKNDRHSPDALIGFLQVVTLFYKWWLKQWVGPEELDFFTDCQYHVFLSENSDDFSNNEKKLL